MASLINSAYDSLTSAFRRGLIKVLAAGPVPQHIAFVMDGNRRYARQRNMAIKQGHTDGFYALRQVCPSSVPFWPFVLVELIICFVLRQMLEICLRLGVKCVTVFAFSIENFKRSEDEVEALMELAETKLLELTKHGYVLSHPSIYLLTCARL